MHFQKKRGKTMLYSDAGQQLYHRQRLAPAAGPAHRGGGDGPHPGRGAAGRQLNPPHKTGCENQATLEGGGQDFVILQEMSHGAHLLAPKLFNSVKRLCEVDSGKGELLPSCSPPGPHEKAAPSWPTRAGTSRTWPGSFCGLARQPPGENHALLKWASGSTICPPPILSTLPRRPPQWGRHPAGGRSPGGNYTDTQGLIP